MAGISEIEFSYRLPADTVGKARKDLRIVADEAARRALARRFGLIAIDSFIADISVSRIADGPLIRVSGSICADIVQACVVLQEPVATRIAEAISERLGPRDQDDAEAVFDIGDEDPPVPLNGDTIELGELLTQILAVSIDPYPRAAGVAPPSAAGTQDAIAGSQGRRPFESLAILKKNRP